MASMPLSYNRVNLTPPPVPQMPTSGSILSMVQDLYNQANAANQQRYQQGLQVLGSGMDLSRRLMRKGKRSIRNIGNLELQDIGEREQADIAGSMQSAISRGLNNTTIRDALISGNRRTADRARLGVRDMQAKARIGQYNAMAGNERGGAGEIASFIAARNDIAPSISELAGLVERRAANQTGGTTNTGTVTRRTGFTSGGGGALGSGGTISGAISGGISGGGIGLYPGSPGGPAEVYGGGGGTPVPPATNTTQPPTAPPPSGPPSVGPTINPTGTPRTLPWWMWAPGGRPILTNTMNSQV